MSASRPQRPSRCWSARGAGFGRILQDSGRLRRDHRCGDALPRLSTPAGVAARCDDAHRDRILDSCDDDRRGYRRHPSLCHSTGVSPELLAISAGAGSLIFSHVNDGGFWLVKEYFGMSVSQTIKTWSVCETIISVTALLPHTGDVVCSLRTSDPDGHSGAPEHRQRGRCAFVASSCGEKHCRTEASHYLFTDPLPE